MSGGGGAFGKKGESPWLRPGGGGGLGPGPNFLILGSAI